MKLLSSKLQIADCKGCRLSCRLGSPTVHSFEFCIVTSLFNSDLQTDACPIFLEVSQAKEIAAGEGFQMITDFPLI